MDEDPFSIQTMEAVEAEERRGERVHVPHGFKNLTAYKEAQACTTNEAIHSTVATRKCTGVSAIAQHDLLLPLLVPMINHRSHDAKQTDFRTPATFSAPKM